MVHSCAPAVALFAVAAILLSLSVPVAAEIVTSETVTLEAGQWKAYNITLSFLDSLRISVQVTNGGPIDVFTTNDFGYAQYTDTNPNSSVFGYYSEASALNQTSFDGRFTPPTSGEYHVIVDNTAITDRGAVPTGQVTASVTLDRTSLLPIVAGILITIIAVPLVTVWFLRSRRRVRSPVRAPPAKGPPPPSV